MDLEELSQNARLLKKPRESGQEATSDPADDAEDSLSYEELQDEETQGQDDPGPLDESPSPAEFAQAHKDGALLAREKAREAELYRRMLEQTHSSRQAETQRADDESFINEIRAAYHNDPVAATAAMIQRAQEDFLRSVDDRIVQTLEGDRDFKQLLDHFLSDAANSGLRPYEDELAFLIRDKGLHATEAAELLRKVENKNSRSSNRRTAAAKEIRNRSMVESEGEIGEPLDDEKEFERTMKKAKNLDEMFANLRKLKV